MSDLPDAYAKLRARWKDLALLGATGGLLGWDQETLLPPNGHSFRAEQASLLAGNNRKRVSLVQPQAPGSLGILNANKPPAPMAHHS